MSDREIIKKLILIPQLFNEIRTVSIYDLLEQTGYFQHYEQIPEKDILLELIQNPGSVSEWLFVF